MKIIKFILGAFLTCGSLLTISRYNGEHIAQLIVPVLVLVLGIWLIRKAFA
ncbi:hypothetical protein [Flavobacterium sp. N2270]|uniref:hypothetical protein n=1 Tax=Flavobacterium sp. N2270 TaxID=2986831 RepID=UPI002224380F|nr:hypothetical protein [Flavobacterium sp. N2270]